MLTAVARVVVRDAEVEDIDVLADVYRRSSLANEGDRVHLLAYPELLKWAPDALGHGHTRVAVADGCVVGFATTAIRPESLELDDLFVDPDSMKRGVGRALVVDAVARAQTLGIRRITVTANKHALGFYERVGFVTSGVAETQFGPAPRMYLDISSEH